MLIKKPQTTKFRMSIELPTNVAKQLEDIRNRAASNGYALELEGAIADFIEREVRKADKLIPRKSSD